MSVQQRVGPYTLLDKLGEGGMGVVHLARDPSGRRVALKTMRPELAAREEFRRRFGKETEAARRVARFCTAPVLDAGYDRGTAYLVTEFVEGPDLASVVARAPLTGSNLEALAVGVATALAAIHQAGVVHRDLKPSNVLLSPVGPRVIDFGVAQLADTPGAAATIATAMGTPAYMSPEQARGEHVTPAGDIFSWGALVTFAGTGRPPFGTGGVPEVVYRVINHAPKLDGLDERIRPLVERALDKDPARRPTAQQLVDGLLGRNGVPVAAATKAVAESWTPLARSAPRSASRSASRSAPRRIPWTPILIGVLAAAVGVGVTLAAVRPWEQPGKEPGTPAAVSTIDALGSRLEVRIDSLVRQGTRARLQWTVKNVGTGNAPLHGKLGSSVFDATVSRVSIVPPGVGNPLHPAFKDGHCQCFAVPNAPFGQGAQLQLWAVFEGLPETADRVDVNLGPLGSIKNVAVTEA
ncbi:serine/threonine-protein kinase [Nonomuraea gerenzanensis]|uniref:Putative serine/threonine protein kinase n=1 Tax=Nonomuraea gerenzanensis TaxID=93944 RepID=A0A1M4EJL1_9ACTN|nr:serine/threonine-protein kinase [Nonomuraea gerenzanensis]UBU10652.1 serine/threonine protein kinase [Nonomuraea gerenzanensis]SBO99071.1 putative serine/threonine protein kinase [Nonomuraea gerenzanensis]